MSYDISPSLRPSHCSSMESLLMGHILRFPWGLLPLLHPAFSPSLPKLLIPNSISVSYGSESKLQQKVKWHIEIYTVCVSLRELWNTHTYTELTENVLSNTIRDGFFFNFTKLLFHCFIFHQPLSQSSQVNQKLLKSFYRSIAHSLLL